MLQLLAPLGWSLKSACCGAGGVGFARLLSGVYGLDYDRAAKGDCTDETGRSRTRAGIPEPLKENLGAWCADKLPWRPQGLHGDGRCCHRRILDYVLSGLRARVPAETYKTAGRVKDGQRHWLTAAGSGRLGQAPCLDSETRPRHVRGILNFFRSPLKAARFLQALAATRNRDAGSGTA
jgi:hypothetical protein